jgi:ATP-dependent Clp protease ATP-binding subunit ClpC
MLSYSPSLIFAWQIAAAETAQAGFQFIEKEQILIGLLKVGDLLDSRVQREMELGIPGTELELLEKELLPFEALLSDFKLDRVKLRRALRGLLGKGDYIHMERVVHRSELCKACFKQAEEIAQNSRSLTLRPIHLFEAILEKPGETITQALAIFGVEPEALRNAASRVVQGEPVLAGGREKEKEEKKSSTPFLDRFGVDLTQLAWEGKIEPMIGRRDELLKVIRTLTRKTKNNPLLIGDAGVGKTAIARGLALRIAQGNITPTLRDKRIIEIGMASLVAGTKYRGEFEDRIVRILEESKNNEDVILFIDEIHTLMGAGSAGGSLDAANIMKPALSKGEITCIGATTLSEYRKYIEQDAALERRFQPIMVGEPAEEETLEMLKGLKERYEKHHQVLIAPSALEAAVKLSVRYLPDRHLPDKALDVLDEACTRVRVDALSFYGKVEDFQSKTAQVTEEIIAKVVADWSGRPVEGLDEEEQERLLRIEEELRRRVIGQDEAVRRVSKTIKMARAGLKDPKRPLGVFLFVGPTGVGKTELAKALAQFLFGSEDGMIRLDMSEYMEKHSVAKLIGAPPGYVGYEEEGQLTGRLRRRPYSVVLLDEVEKAHPEVLDLFLQLFDEGRVTGNKGRTVDARHAVFIMTSNIGGKGFNRQILGFGGGEEEGETEKRGSEGLKKFFKPELLNRIDEVVIFDVLKEQEIVRITAKMMGALIERLSRQGVGLEVEDEALSFLAGRGFDLAYGARYLARGIEESVAMPLAEKILKGEIKKGDKVKIKVAKGKIVFMKE